MTTTITLIDKKDGKEAFAIEMPTGPDAQATCSAVVNRYLNRPDMQQKYELQIANTE